MQRLNTNIFTMPIDAHHPLNVMSIAAFTSRLDGEGVETLGKVRNVLNDLKGILKGADAHQRLEDRITIVNVAIMEESLASGAADLLGMSPNDLNDDDDLLRGLSGGDEEGDSDVEESGMDWSSKSSEGDLDPKGFTAMMGRLELIKVKAAEAAKAKYAAAVEVAEPVTAEAERAAIFSCL